MTFVHFFPSPSILLPPLPLTPSLPAFHPLSAPRISPSLHRFSLNPHTMMLLLYLSSHSLIISLTSTPRSSFSLTCYPSIRPLLLSLLFSTFSTFSHCVLRRLLTPSFLTLPLPSLHSFHLYSCLLVSSSSLLLTLHSCPLVYQSLLKLLFILFPPVTSCHFCFFLTISLFSHNHHITVSF